MTKLIPLTLLAWASNDREDFASKPVAVNPASINYLCEIDMTKPIPIIGEENNITSGTQITFNKEPSIVVRESVSEVIELINAV